MLRREVSQSLEYMVLDGLASLFQVAWLIGDDGRGKVGVVD
jgi:hypothetical protein